MIGRRITRAVRWPLAGVAAVLLATAAAGAAPAWSAGGVEVVVMLDGRDTATADANDPLRLVPDDGVVVSVVVTNTGSAPVEVRHVKLDSTVLGLAFFTYSTRVDLTVAAGGTGTRTFALDLFDLGGQATGLLPARVSLLDPDRETLVSERLTVDVRGSAFSVYGIFGLTVAALTALLLFGLVTRLLSGRLPANRLARAWRFLLPGLGLGLTATVAASVVRAFVPSTKVSLLLMALGAAAGFVAGYLSPRPGDTGDEDALDDRDLAVDDLPARDSGFGILDLDRPASGGSRTTVVGGTIPPPPEQ